MAKKVQAMVKLQIPAGKATPAPPVGHRARSARREHHGLLQELQREDGEGRRADHPGRGHDLRRPQLHLHHQDAAGVGAAEEDRQPGQGLGRAEPEQGRHGDGQAGRGHRQAEDAGPQLPRTSTRRSRPCAARRGRWASTSSGNDAVELRSRVASLSSAQSQVRPETEFDVQRGRTRERAASTTRRHMAKHGKKFTAAAAQVQDRPYTLEEAIPLIQKVKFAKFDETVELAMRLGVDPEARRPDGARHGRPAARPRQEQAGAGDCRRRQAEGSAPTPAPTSSAATRSSRRSSAAGWTSTRSSRRRT